MSDKVLVDRDLMLSLRRFMNRRFDRDRLLHEQIYFIKALDRALEEKPAQMSQTSWGLMAAGEKRQ